ncbi:hypothetical protein HED60_13460 [Planctomycetales bacterium ZRK34]|nr:hypothetical protein HED60_13460 [Planctomycetales bacterium ZRK34]
MGRVLGIVQRSAQSIWVTTGLMMCIGAVVLGIAAAVMLDQYLVLPMAMRLLLLAAVIGSTVMLVRWCLRQKPGYDVDDSAQLVESAYPELNNLLINALQLGREPSDDPNVQRMIEAVQSEAQNTAGRLNPKQAVSRHHLHIAAGVFAAGIIIFVGQWALFGNALNKSLGRILMPLADNTYTQIMNITPGDQDVRIDTDVTIVAEVGGRVPSQATLRCLLANGERIDVPMTPRSAQAPDQLSAVVNQIRQSMTYRIEAGDDVSSVYELRVHEAPAVQKITQKITPPAYLGNQPIEQVGGAVTATTGSTVHLDIITTQPLKEAWLTIDDQQRQSLPVSAGPTDPDGHPLGQTTAQLKVEKPARYSLQLVSEQGLESEPMAYDVIPVADQAPQVSFVDPTGELTAEINATVQVQFQAIDDHALSKIELVRITAEDQDKPEADRKPVVIGSWTVDGSGDATRSLKQAMVRVAELSPTADRPGMLRVAAYDRRPEGQPGWSQPLLINLPKIDEEAPAAVAAARKAIDLTKLIEDQRLNLAAAQALSEGKTGDPIDVQVQRQEAIHTLAEVIGNQKDESAAPGAENPIRRRVKTMSQTLMVLAIEQLRKVQMSGTNGDLSGLTGAIDTEKAILAMLTMTNQQQQQELAAAGARQATEALAELIAKQRALHKDTKAKSESGNALAARQLVLSRQIVVVQKTLAAEASSGAGGNADLAALLEKGAQAILDQKVRESMLFAVEDLGNNALDPAAAKQQQVIDLLSSILKTMNKTAIAEAKKELDQAKDEFQKAEERVERLADLQQSIVESSKQLEKMKDLRDGLKTDARPLNDYKDAKADLADAIETLTKDMHVLPESVASNDLVAEFNEIYEDVKQPPGSENAAAIEIAVDRDENMLKTLRKMQEKMGERLADLEMWLKPDPDNISWKSENFEKKEMGEMPLGDLPDTLEDIVGDLVEQSEEIAQEAQDTTSNTGLPDMTMGWDIADGTIPSWAAKGKSGNAKPNDNEMPGRSGSGRQGQSSGEMVGDTLKALEGADVKVRRTNEGFQAGQVREEKPGFMDAKATGGGKVGGTSNKKGMVGDAPARNELQYREMARQVTQLKSNAQTVYSRAKLLRLPTGELDRAILELDTALRRLDDGDMLGFAQTQQRVVKQLKQTQGLLAGKTIVEGASVAERSEQIAGATREPIPKEYEQSVADYMRRIAQQP